MTCEDCISRSMAIEKLKEHYSDKELQSAKNDPCVIDAMTDLDIRIIRDLPSVAHTQKMGRWIFTDKTYEYGRCSECGYGIVDLVNGKPHNYCPNCGAKMGEDALTTMMSISDYKLIKKEGYNDGYYWDTRYCFELNGMRYILTDVGSCSGYIPNRGEIMEVENDENLDMLLKDWDADKIDKPDDLSEEDAIKYVKQLKDSGTAKGEAFVLWSHD